MYCCLLLCDVDCYCAPLIVVVWCRVSLLVDVRRCLQIVVCCLLVFVVVCWCLLVFVDCCELCGVSCLLLRVCCLLCVAYCLLFAVCCSLLVVCWLLFVVCCL